MLTTHLDRPTIRAALALANWAPSVHNSQPWRWRIGPSSVHLQADPRRALAATDPEQRDLRISCGAALHHVRVALRAAGFDTTVHRLPDPAHPSHVAALEPFPAEPTPDDLALAGAIERRRSDRRMFSSWPVPPELLAGLTVAARREGAALRILELGSERGEVVRLVRASGILQGRTPGTAEEIAEWTGRSAVATDGIAASNVPAQPRGAVPVRDVAAADQAETDLGPGESDGTVLAMLSTAGDDPEDQVRAGEALSAVLLEATRIGLATDPISQPLEVPSTRAELRARLLAGEAEPQVLLRLGWAPISAEPMPRSGRRPVDETIDPWDAPWP